MAIEGHETRVRALDGAELAATQFRPEGPARGAVVVAGAMGVPRRFYAPFAAHLASLGLEALTFDYRGIGGSRPASLVGFAASMSDWGEKDLAGAIAHAGRNDATKVLLVGHSAGGQLVGLAPTADRLSGCLFVGSQSGYWRNWPLLGQLRMAALWWLVIPVAARAAGYLPMSKVGSGEDVPRGVALQWASWGRHPEYVMSHAKATGSRGYERFARPIRAYAVRDDHYAPRATVEALLAFYTSAEKELRDVGPADVGANAIGHFGFFRERFKESLWKEAGDWLVAKVT